MARESTRQTFQVALLLCLVCSFLVSFSAVTLRERQKQNRADEMRRNILKAAFPGQLDAEGGFEELFEERGVKDLSEFFERFVKSRRVTMGTGEDVATTEAERDYDQVEASRDPASSSGLDLAASPGRDIAGIKRREDVGWVHLVQAASTAGDDGRVETVVVPIRGYGLWSTLKGFIAIDVASLRGGPEAATVRGLAYYSHGETPGLGGEVDNVNWKSKWPGKRIFDKAWAVQLRVTKSPSGPHDVDALTGATITSNGVSNMLAFWLGEDGYGPFLRRLARKESEVPSGEGVAGG